MIESFFVWFLGPTLASLVGFLFGISAVVLVIGTLVLAGVSVAVRAADGKWWWEK